MAFLSLTEAMVVELIPNIGKRSKFLNKFSILKKNNQVKVK